VTVASIKQVPWTVGC